MFKLSVTRSNEPPLTVRETLWLILGLLLLSCICLPISLSRGGLLVLGFFEIGLVAFRGAEIFVVAVVAPDLFDRLVTASAVSETFFFIFLFFSHIVLFMRLEFVFSYELCQVSFALQV